MISVQVIRRIDTRIPTPLLSTFMTPPSGLGKLADYRAVKANTQSSSSSSSPSWRPTMAVPPATITTKSWNMTTSQTQGSSSNAPPKRGWTSVVASGASTSTSTSSSAAADNTSTHSSSVLAPKPTTSLEVVGSSLSRTVSPAHFPSEPVPEDWEDDV